MNNDNELREKEVFMLPSFQNYVDLESDVAYTSKITEFVIESATKLKFNYEMPEDNIVGQVVIWKGLIADKSENPVYQASLSQKAGSVVVEPGNLNFLNGAYTIAVTADGNLNTIAATQSILAGQPVQQGMSSLMVIAKTLTGINTVFNRPSNALASSDITWLILREGATLGKGNRKAIQTTTSGSSSGLVPVHFPAGTLKNGEMYNVVLNPGYTTATFTAGFVFKYVVQ